jgi:hypothetical protein
MMVRVARLKRQIVQCACVVAALFARAAFAEEQHSAVTDLSSTTLSGYVDISSAWWVGQMLQPLHDNRQPPLPPIPTNDPSTLGNDNFANATAITMGANFLPPDLASATLEPGEPTNTGESGSLWFRWTIPTTGTARLSALTLVPCPAAEAKSTAPALSDESIFYPWGGIWYPGGGGVITTTVPPPPPIYRHSITVYRGTGLQDLQVVARGQTLEFAVQAGETLLVAFENYSSGGFLIGSLPTSFNADVTAPPANDSFASTLSINESSKGDLNGHLLGATRETGEPDLGADFAGGSVWFHFTAATHGNVSLGNMIQPVPCAVFTGSDVAHLQLVAKDPASGVSFFGEQGKTYHIALYRGAQNAQSFSLAYTGPKYRLYETSFAELMPPGLTPHFYGLRGATLLLYAKTATGWDCVEIEPIVDYATALLARPSTAVDGKLRVISIDEFMPAPRVEISHANGVTASTLIGLAGQTCAVSYSADLVNWTTPQVFTLGGEPPIIHIADDRSPGAFYRITRSLPVPDGPTKQLEPPH